MAHSNGTKALLSIISILTILFVSTAGYIVGQKSISADMVTLQTQVTGVVKQVERHDVSIINIDGNVIEIKEDIGKITAKVDKWLEDMYKVMANMEKNSK